jgi:hypothetical protein
VPTIRIEAATTAELDQAEAAVRRVFEVASVRGDYRNRKRRHGAERVPGWRRYLDVTPLPVPDLSPSPARMFGYVQGSGVRPEQHQVTAARAFLDRAAAGDQRVEVAAVELAREILDRAADVEPARARLCRGAVCLDEPCVHQVAGECTR